MILWRHPGKNVFESKSWFRFIRIHSLKHTDIFLPREIWPSSKTDAPEENSFWLWGLDAPVSRTNHVLPAAPFVSVFNYVSFVYLSFWTVLGPCCTDVINACSSTRLNSTWRKNLFCTLIFLTWTPKGNDTLILSTFHFAETAKRYDPVFNQLAGLQILASYLCELVLILTDIFCDQFYEIIEHFLPLFRNT
jgi:hypothetical protein